MKKALGNLVEQLLIDTKNANLKKRAGQIKKETAYLKYRRIQALKDKDIPKLQDIDSKLKNLAKESKNPTAELDPAFVKGFELPNSESNEKSNERAKTHLQDAANFLSYQRTYQELIERYNPGLSMTQTDKIRKTANRVGFSLPKTNADETNSDITSEKF